MIIEIVKGLLDFGLFFNRSKDERIEWLTVGSYSLLIGVALLLLGIYTDEIYGKLCLLYLAALLLVIVLHIFISNFVTRGKDTVIKRVPIYFVTGIFFLITAPISVIIEIMVRARIISIVRNIEIFMMGVITAFATGLIVFFYLPRILAHIPYCNEINMWMTAVLILSRQAMMITIYIGFQLRMKRENFRIKKGRSIYTSFDDAKSILKEEHKDMKKELAIFIFAIIAGVTAVLYLFNIKDMFPDNELVIAMSDGILYAFTLYTGFEAVAGKWKERKGTS